MTDTTLATDKLIQDHFEPPSQEDLEGVPQPSFSQTSDLIHPANNLTEPGLDPSDEIISERTERTKTYLLDEEEGRYRTIGSIPKAHYRDNPDDPDEQLKELDMTIEEQDDRFQLKQEAGSSNAPYELEAFKGQIGYGVAHKGGGEVHLTLEEIGNQKITPNFLSARADTTVGGNLIEWNIRGLGISIRLIARPEKVEIFKTIKNENSPRKFRWTVAESKEDDARFTFNPHGASGHDNQGDNLELNENRNVVEEDSKFEYSEYVEEFTGRSAQIDDPETRSRSWQSAEYPVEIDPSTSKDISANIDDVNASANGNFYKSEVRISHYSLITYYNYAGLRFRSLGIGQGASITSATLQGYVNEDASGLEVRVYADDVDNAPQWSSNDVPQDITKTSNYYDWNTLADSTGSHTASITPIFQEIISRSGWSSGNAARFLLSPYSAPGSFNYRAYLDDYSDSSPDVATLSVTYTKPPPPDTSTTYETFPDVPHILDRDRRSGQVTSDASNEFRDFRQLNHRPFYAYTLDMSVLSPGDQDKIQDLSITHSGYDGSSGNVRFLFKDPDDNSVSDVQFGTGDGSTKKFQLKNKYTFGSQSIKYPQGHIDEGTETIKNDGSTVSDSDIGINYDTGTVEFRNAPADGNALTASFEFFRLCQFRDSEVSVSIETAARRNQTIEIVEVAGA